MRYDQLETYEHDLVDRAVLRERLLDPARHRRLEVRRQVAQVRRVVKRACLWCRGARERDERSEDVYGRELHFGVLSVDDFVIASLAWSKS